MLKTKLSEAEERIRYYEGQRQMSSSLSPERDAAMAPLISLESPAQASNPGFSLPASPSPTPTDPNKVSEHDRIPDTGGGGGFGRERGAYSP